mmetsp:Transcript_71089/g.153214  ORF Transcript_71089/g.153214 Transcript_71089/m.153214 type:complete len:315 (+) Transcript_71089:174-1118(+)
MLENEDDATEMGVAGPLTVRAVAKQDVSKRAAKKSGVEGSGAPAKSAAKTLGSASSALAENPWMDAPADADEAPEAGKAAEAKNPGQKGGKRKRRRENMEAKELAESTARAAPLAAKDDIGQEEHDEAGEDLLNVFSMDSEAAREQRNLVRTAFVQGSQMDDFEDEQEELAREKEEKDNADDRLPGWGGWTGTGIRARKPRPKKQEPEPETKKPSRVQVFEGAGKESAKYFVDKVPYPYQNVEQYDQQMKMPTGPEWNTLPMHLGKIKPKLFVKVGAIVPPLEYVKHLATDAERDSAIKTWSAGKQPKRQKARF